MTVNTDILIIGGGPGGLACAKLLAENGRKVLVCERRPTIGRKVCAGGITWSGFLQHIPARLIQGSFAEQTIASRYQRIVVSEPQPIVATVDRVELGEWMASEARQAGAEIITNAMVRVIDKDAVTVVRPGKRMQRIQYRRLIGADGANSKVRDFLGLPTEKMGIGLNCMLEKDREQMEWHLNTRLFGHGYAWIFPHRDRISVGAYCGAAGCSAPALKSSLVTWAAEQGLNLTGARIQAGLINYDYRGHAFGNTWLVGEAAGLASGLTGEGIFPAIVSGRTVASTILNPDHAAEALDSMIEKQRLHHKVITLAATNPLACAGLMELLVMGLRLKLIKFQKLEMAATNN